MRWRGRKKKRTEAGRGRPLAKRLAVGLAPQPVCSRLLALAGALELARARACARLTVVPLHRRWRCSRRVRHHAFACEALAPHSQQLIRAVADRRAASNAQALPEHVHRRCDVCAPRQIHTWVAKPALPCRPPLTPSLLGVCSSLAPPARRLGLRPPPSVHPCNSCQASCSPANKHLGNTRACRMARGARAVLCHATFPLAPPAKNDAPLPDAKRTAPALQPGALNTLLLVTVRRS